MHFLAIETCNPLCLVKAHLKNIMWKKRTHIPLFLLALDTRLINTEQVSLPGCQSGKNCVSGQDLLFHHLRKKYETA